MCGLARQLCDSLEGRRVAEYLPGSVPSVSHRLRITQSQSVWAEQQLDQSLAELDDLREGRVDRTGQRASAQGILRRLYLGGVDLERGLVSRWGRHTAKIWRAPDGW